MFSRDIPVPEMPQNWTVNEAEFENVLACYVWRYIHVMSHANINLSIWKDTFWIVLEHCWYKIIALFEAVFDKWVSDLTLDHTDFVPDCGGVDCQIMYYMAMEKRRYRRKSQDVRQYEDVDEYVDNMYLYE